MSEHRHHGIDRMDRILDVVARSPEPPRLTDITAATDLPRSTTADLVGELRRHGYLDRVGSRYRLGRRMQVLAMIARLSPPSPIDHSRLEELSRIAATPLALAALVGGEILYLDTAGPQALRRLQRIADEHHPRPALRTAAGRLLLAFADDEQRDGVLRGVGATDPESVAAFLSEKPAILRARLARSDGLADPEIRAIAIPVYEHTTVTAAIVLLGPRSRQHSPAAGLALEQAAARLLATSSRDTVGHSSLPDAGGCVDSDGG